MEELSFAEKKKLENSKAHLQVILGNIRVANNELSLLHKEIAGAEEKLDDIMNDIPLASDRHAEILIQTEQQLKKLADKEELLEKKGIILEANTSVWEERISFLKAEQVRIQNEMKQNIATSTKTLKETEHELLKKSTELEKLKEQNKKYEQSIKEKDKEYQSLERLVNNILKEKEEAEGLLERFKRNSSKEMEKITASIESEKKKIKRPMELLQEANDFVDQKTRNMEILERRLRKQFKMMFPDQEPLI
jgi:chromosome segregation ATPase